MNKISTTVEPEKRGVEPRSAWTGESPIPTQNVPTATISTQTGAGRKHGWGSRLRSYFIFNPLIWAYT
ncbi:MAG: hypothetical protein WBR11_03220, partial [Terriglobales bacterium]